MAKKAKETGTGKENLRYQRDLSKYRITNALMFPDPFIDAISKLNAASVGGLLGKLPPLSIARVEEHFGKATNLWGQEEWRKSAELLAYWVDALRLQLQTKDALNAPKRRGRPTKSSAQLNGLLSLGLFGTSDTAKKGGRPRKYTEQFMVLLADTLDKIREEQGLSSYDAAIAKLLELMANKAGKPLRSMTKQPLKVLKNSLRNAACRGRIIRSKPPG